MADVMSMMNLGIPAAVIVIVSILSLFVSLPLSAFALWLAGRVLKLRITFLKSLIPALIVWLAGGLITGPSIFMDSMLFKFSLFTIGFVVTAGISLILPKFFFNLEWKEGLLAGLLWIVFNYLITLALGFIVFILVFFLIFVIGIGAFLI